MVNLVAGLALFGAGMLFVGGAGLIPGLFLIGAALAAYRVPEELLGRAGLLARWADRPDQLPAGHGRLRGRRPGHRAGRVGPVGAAIALGAGILVVQAVVSPLWLRRFRYGPMEWLWRCATWWRWMPIRLREVRATT